MLKQIMYTLLLLTHLTFGYSSIVAQENSNSPTRVEFDFMKKVLEKYNASRPTIITKAMVNEKYPEVVEQLAKLETNPEYIQELMLLNEKYPDVLKSISYYQERTALIAKYIPEYPAYHKELIVAKDH